MLEFEFSKAEIGKIQRTLKAISPANRNKVYEKGFRRASLFLEEKLKENISGRFLKVRSGRLRNSIGAFVSRDKDGMVAKIGSGARTGDRVSYANIQETGGVVRPVNGKYLTIPTQFALTAAGVPRFTARQVFEGVTPYDGGVIIGRMLFGYTSTQKKDTLTPLFSLVTSVTVPASGYMSKTMKENTKSVVGIMTDSIEEALKTQ